jgi:hypothetical protein
MDKGYRVGTFSRRFCFFFASTGLASLTFGGLQGASAMMPSETIANAQGYGLRVVGDSRDLQVTTEQIRRAATDLLRARIPNLIALASNDQRLASPNLIIISLNVSSTSLRVSRSNEIECIVISGRIIRSGVTGSLKPAEIEVIATGALAAQLSGPQSALKALLDRLLR